MCRNLTNIKNPNSVTSIGDGAFSHCRGLTSIGDGAFYGTAWYDNQQDGNIYINNVYYEYKGTMPTGTQIKIKEGTKQICARAFSGCSGLTSIEIPSSVTSIGDDAFWRCSGLAIVNYKGTKEQWNQIIIESGNEYLTSATINYNYTGE